MTSFEESLPLEGVAVCAKSDAAITGTMPDGRFSLLMLANENILVLNLPGYKPKELALTSAKEYDLVLRRLTGYELQ